MARNSATFTFPGKGYRRFHVRRTLAGFCRRVGDPAYHSGADYPHRDQISYSVAHGRRANVPLVTAVALGDSTALVLSLLGLGALLKASAFWFTAIKWTGGLYLIYLGIKLLRAGMNAADVAAPAAPDSRWRLFANTYAVTALNPKGMIFFVAFLPKFLNPGTEVVPQLWVLAVTFVALATLNATLYAVFAATARRVLTSPRAQRRFHLAGGSLLSAAGAWALLARRAG